MEDAGRTRLHKVRGREGDGPAEGQLAFDGKNAHDGLDGRERNGFDDGVCFGAILGVISPALLHEHAEVVVASAGNVHILELRALSSFHRDVDPVGRDVVIRMSPGNHLVEEHAERENICLLVVHGALLPLADVEDFGCNEPLGALQTLGSHGSHVGGYTKVCYFAVAQRSRVQSPQEDVGSFEVAKYNPLPVEKPQCCCNLGSDSENRQTMDGTLFLQQWVLQRFARCFFQNKGHHGMYGHTYQANKARMVRLLQQLCLGPQFREGVFVLCEVLLDGHWFVQASSPIHLPKAPFPEEICIVLLVKDVVWVEQEVWVNVLQQEVWDNVCQRHGVVLGVLITIVTTFNGRLVFGNNGQALVHPELKRFGSLGLHALVARHSLLQVVVAMLTLGESRVPLGDEREDQVHKLSDNLLAMIAGRSNDEYSIILLSTKLL